MASILQADPIPLREDASGTLRVGETRVLLDLVVRAFEDGATVDSWPGLRRVRRADVFDFDPGRIARTSARTLLSRPRRSGLRS